MRGLDGAFLVLPRRQRRSSRPDVDVMFTLQEFEWDSEGALVKPFGTMGNFGWRTINGRTGDASGGPITIRRGDVVRIRLYNASNSVHTMHLHGHDEILIAKNGHRVRPVRETSQPVGPGDFVEIEFKANNPGNWIFHCHFPHHTSNKMNAGYNGAPVGMTRIFHYAGYRRVSPKYFSDAHFKSESISK